MIVGLGCCNECEKGLGDVDSDRIQAAQAYISNQQILAAQAKAAQEAAQRAYTPGVQMSVITTSADQAAAQVASWANQITNAYRTYLHREPEAGAVSADVNILLNNPSDSVEAMVGRIGVSPEAQQWNTAHPIIPTSNVTNPVNQAAQVSGSGGIVDTVTMLMTDPSSEWINGIPNWALIVAGLGGLWVVSKGMKG